MTAQKVANNAVTTAKLRNNAVTTAKIRNNAVTTAKIRDGTITAAKLAAGVQTQGPAGPKGDTGATGATGPAGPQGPTGPTASVLASTTTDSPNLDSNLTIVIDTAGDNDIVVETNARLVISASVSLKADKGALEAGVAVTCRPILATPAGQAIDGLLAATPLVETGLAGIDTLSGPLPVTTFPFINAS